MKNIIIVGTGKAALLHYNSYKRSNVEGRVFFTDIKTNSKYIYNQKIYSSIDECIIENNLNFDSVIVDICTPKSEFLNIIDHCNNLGITDILVEKPFVVTKDFFEQYKNLNIVMVENYLFSKLTELIKDYLDKSGKKIQLIYTNFSKNRVRESLEGRGYNYETTLNYEIEIPHQVYLTQYLLGNPSDIQNSITCSRDLRIGDKSLENHGYGLIISKYNDVDIIYESNLASIISQKRIIVCTEDNYSIEGNYALYSDTLQLLKPANISIYHNGELISSETIDEDDNFTYFINSAYNYFNNQIANPNYIDIISFSNIMKLYCDNLIRRKKRK